MSRSPFSKLLFEVLYSKCTDYSTIHTFTFHSNVQFHNNFFLPQKEKKKHPPRIVAVSVLHD